MIVEDASFIRIRHITLGYNLPKSIAQKLMLDNLRIYLTAKNPFTITNYSGYNPEVTSTGTSWTNKPTTPGVDWGSYPIAKSYVIGVNLTF